MAFVLGPRVIVFVVCVSVGVDNFAFFKSRRVLKSIVFLENVFSDTTGTTRAAFASLVAWLVTLVACTRETCTAPTLEVMVSASATATASTTATAATVGTSAATAASSGVILLACGCDHPRELVGLAVRLHLSAELSLVETFMCYVVA